MVFWQDDNYNHDDYILKFRLYMFIERTRLHIQIISIIRNDLPSKLIYEDPTLYSLGKANCKKEKYST